MSVIASRYARAFSDVVFDMKLDPNRTVSEVQVLQQLVQQNSDLRRVWEDPSIPSEQKRAVLDGLVSRLGTSRQVRNFYAVLIDHRRIALLDDIVGEFQHEILERLGFAEAQVSSARELSESERRDLESQISQLTGKRVQAKYSVDPKLLGGAVVQVGTTIYDGSIHGQLQRMRDELVMA
ncbi:MAG TPA: ATP synthase F1 subunit delta [Terriglobales bacterium]|nr:ATP synthase F1 subunit delta [Terriglobales bacterium]